MAFPQTAAPTESSFGSAASSFAVSMPATVNSGDGLLMIFGHDDSGLSAATPSGWGKLRERETLLGFGGIGYLFVKVADGTEGGTTVTVSVTGGTATAAAQVYRFTDWAGVATGFEAADDDDSGTTLDPPSLEPTWPQGDTLWIAAFACGDDDATVSAYPSSYTGGTDTVSGGGANNGHTIGSAVRELNASSEDPGTFTLSASQFGAVFTIAIRQAGETITADGSASGSATVSGVGLQLGTVEGAGSSAGIATVSGVVVATGDFAGSSSGAATVTAVGVTFGRGFGEANGLALVSGVSTAKEDSPYIVTVAESTRTLTVDAVSAITVAAQTRTVRRIPREGPDAQKVLTVD